MEVLISMLPPVVRFNNTGFQAEMRVKTAYIYCTYHAKIWELFSFSIIGALVVGFWTCTAWPLANFPFPCPVGFFLHFLLLFSLIQKERPKWLACMPCQINMGIPVMRAGLALPGRDLSCPRPFAAVLLSMTRLGMWYHSTSLFNFADSLQDTSIYLTINLQIFQMMASRLLRGPESNCRVCTLYAEWEWPGFDSPDSPADIFDFKVYLRPQNSLAIGANIPRHFTRIINSNADVVFCFLVLASRYGWYDIRLDFCFTNSLWGCS